MLALEERERERTGIASLKVRYNASSATTSRSRARTSAACPSDYRRKQTVANGERYVTAELDELERKILRRRRAAARRSSTSSSTRCARASAQHAPRLLRAGRSARRARRARGARRGRAPLRLRAPRVDDSLALELERGRHPVVERWLPPGSFVPNDVHARRRGGARLLVITGPNMAGKSTAMRQVALAVILAQMGSFVPARARAHRRRRPRLHARRRERQPRRGPEHVHGRDARDREHPARRDAAARW